MQYGVYFIPVWSFRDEDKELGEYIAEVDSGIVPIYPNTETVCDGCLSMSVSEFAPYDDNNAWLPSDTIDLRWWSFDTEQEAKDHQDYITRHFYQPLPWESFIETRNDTRKAA